MLYSLLIEKYAYNDYSDHGVFYKKKGHYESLVRS